MERVWTPKFRRGIFAGWKSTPTALTGLDFYPPQSNSYTGRIVVYSEDEFLEEEKTKLELYSRNSKQLPFYPGLSSVLIADIPYQRSVDGSIGRFDPTKNPQQFDKTHPYYPFITRPQTAVNALRKPEDVPAFLVWECSPYPREGLGYLSPEYYAALMDRIWRIQTQIREITLDESSSSWPNFRSSQPSKPIAYNWGEEISFDQLVDNLTPLQRWVKELDAWVRMGNLLKRTPRNTQLHLPNTDTTEADDSLIGVWANGMEETDFNWFWMHKIPLFVAHEVKGDKDEPSATTTQRTSDSLLFTDWQDNKTCHEWIGLARRSRITVEENEWDQWIAGQGNEDKSALRFWKSSSLATIVNFPGQDFRTTTESVSDEDTYGPNPPELKVIAENRVPWILPPKVAEPVSKGQWNWFVEDTDDENNRCLRAVSKSARKDLDTSEWSYVYYDRLKKRHLHLYTEIIVPPNLAHDVDVFGLPGPRLLYYKNTEMTVRIRASDWVYKTEVPLRKDIGRSAATPDLESLPRLHSETIPTAQEPTPPIAPPPVRYNYATYPSWQEEEELLDFGEPTPSPVLRPRELSLVRTPSPPAEKPIPTPTSPIPVEEPAIIPTPPMIDDKKLENDAATTLGGQKRKRRSSSEGFDGSIEELLELLSKTCQKTAVEIRIARINKIDTPEGTEFWVKIWNTLEAGWFIQAHYDLPTETGRVFEIRLLGLLPYLECPLLERNSEEQWTRNEVNASTAQIPTPQTNVTIPSPSTSQASSLLSRMDITLQERLEETPRVPLPLTERIELDPQELSSEAQDPAAPISKKRAKSRGGKRHRHWKDILGPVPVNDPQIDMENWTPESWLSQTN
ncbi:hypothetical protein K435DRAFT_810062 [Dendrothele bispora CBS 962.96]|uniref:Uncharacterized protein n=1 Tax=Dendrothele bispora (strain CBS 962.96) TaxID=1314807 RepID=A0A4S8KW64_DENBC|nr:hypothetical protein K435DRAFT_810062 [Dendrothele bispora CBS 962.96]